MTRNSMAERGYRVSKPALRRKMFLCGAAAGSVISLLCAWLDWRNGLSSSVPQDIILALVLIPLYIWAKHTDDATPPTRAGMLVLVLSFIPSIPVELVHMPVFLLWLPAISLLAFYFFGFREGLIWSAGFMVLVLAESFRVLSGVQHFQHESMFIIGIIVYLFLGGMAAAFQYMIEGYERQLLAEAEEKQRVSARMAEIQKLESIGVLAGGIAHDFNNLLVAIMGNAELAVLDAPPNHPEQQRYLENILQAARRGADLVGQMLAYSGQGQISRGMQNINALIRDVSELLSTVIGKHIRLKMMLDEALPDIYGDKNQLIQLVMNLLTNASDAMQGKPGEISLRTGVRHLSAQDCAAMHTLAGHVEPGAFVFIEVTDSGCGMDAAMQSRIFDPFFTTKQTGTGLGLAALHGIVRSHGGTMSLLSAPGKGSCFTIYFPQHTLDS